MVNITNHNHNQIITSHQSGMLLSKRQQMASVGKGAEKRKPLCTVGGMQIGAATVENSMEGHQKLTIELPYDLAVSFLGSLLKKTKTLT